MIETVFSISNISDVTTSEYIKGLTIYNNTTPFEIKTNSNEITYWLSHENSHFKCFAFRFDSQYGNKKVPAIENEYFSCYHSGLRMGFVPLLRSFASKKTSYRGIVNISFSSL